MVHRMLSGATTELALARKLQDRSGRRVYGTDLHQGWLLRSHLHRLARAGITKTRMHSASSIA